MSTETGGLGNRIKSWVSAMRLDDECRVYWAVTPSMPATFAELFDNHCSVDEVPPGARVHKSWRLSILPEDEPHLPRGFATVGGGAHPLIRGLGKMWWSLTGRRTDRYRYMLFPKSHSRRSSRADGRHIDYEYGRIPEHFRRVYLPCFAGIRVRPDIAGEVERYAQQALDERVIGVQVRTWRDYPRRQRKYHLPAVKRLARLMNAGDSRRVFFVVSDSDDIVNDLRDAYGARRVLCFPRQTPRLKSWQSVRGMTEDLIDLWLLARTRRLFASYLSTFSETAWWLGGANAEVDVF